MEISEDQVLYSRARHGHLAGPGAASAVEATRAILGAQAQQLPQALWALSLRTKGRPTAERLTRLLIRSPRRLVRTWGQRDTLHLYDPKEDWPTVVAARQQWAPGGRAGPMPSRGALNKARAIMETAGKPITRTDLLHVAPRNYVRVIEERARQANMDPKRLGAARLIWRLAQDGELCHADADGSEQRYALRTAWFPKLRWPKQLPAGLDAACDLTRRYLRVYGPATARDIAHFFGARVGDVRQWLTTIEGETAPVSCGERKGLMAMAEDVLDLRRKPPAGADAWPVRLLPLWESMLMAHADKSWTLPLESERKLVWRKAAFVSAVVLARGRVVATWSQNKRRGSIEVEVQPLSGWRKTRHLGAVKREAAALAEHLGLKNASVVVAS